MKNFLLLACCFVLPLLAVAQTEIPNADFENWTSAGTYNNVDEWTSLNVLAGLGAPPVASKSTDAVSGSYALKLETVSFFGNKIPGLCYLGRYEINLIDPASGTLFGEPFTGRPLRFRGAYKYAPVGDDVGGISLQLWRTNAATGKRDTIGEATLTAQATGATYQNFDIEIAYSSAETPDSISIVMVSSANEGQYQVGSALYVDKLSFDYSPIGIASVPTDAVALYPNPANEQIVFDAADVPLGSQFLLYNALGELVLSETVVRNALFVAHLANGGYVYSIYTPQGSTKMGRLLIAR